MDTLKVFYMAKVKSNLTIYGVVIPWIINVTFLETKKFRRLHDKRKRSSQRHFKNAP